MKLLNEKGQIDLIRLLLVLLILAFLGLIPIWPYAHSWGYFPGGVVGVILIIVILRLVGLI